ncbi:MAG: hypothetical protein HRT37_12615 [Alteromonadaceae bacterium]|nr:hypothetical protein [Alteromonadaceae bacterium]
MDQVLMKIGIVIPLKAKSISKNWPEVCANVKNTVDSVLSQTNNSFRLAVIGHDCPEQLKGLKHSGDDVFTSFDELQPPSVVKSDEVSTNQMKYEVDRCSKILKGIMVLKKNDADITHWFALDADDLLHNTFVFNLLQKPDYDAFLIENGYFYFKHWGIFNVTYEFYKYCGSSAVIADKFFNLPSKIDESSFRQIPFGNISHVLMGEYFTTNNINFYVPKPKLLMYVRDNGDNISNDYIDNYYNRIKRNIGILVRIKFLPARIKGYFGIR